MDLFVRLKNLLALTTSPNDNEARNAAWMLLKTAREHGVTIVFKKDGVRSDGGPAPAPADAPPRAPEDVVRCPGCGDPNPFGVPSSLCGVCMLRRARARDFTVRCSGCGRRDLSLRPGERCAVCRIRDMMRDAVPPAPPEPRKCSECGGPLETERVERCNRCLDKRYQESLEREAREKRRAPADPGRVPTYEEFLRDYGGTFGTANAAPGFFGVDFSSVPKPPRRK